MSSTTFTFSYGSTNPQSGNWDNISNWGPGTITLGSEDALYPTDSVVLAASDTPYTTYINSVGGDVVDNVTAGSGATIALSPDPATSAFYFQGTIDIQAGATLDTDSSDSADAPMDIGHGDPVYGSNADAEQGSGTIFLDGTLAGSGIIDSSVKIVVGSGTIISTVDPYGNGTGLTIDTTLSGNSSGNLTVITAPGATLELNAAVASNVNFVTAGSGSGFELDQADTFGGTISGLSVSSAAGDAAVLLGGSLTADATSYIDLVGVSDGAADGAGNGNFNTIGSIISAAYLPNVADPSSGGIIRLTVTPENVPSTETINLNVSGDYVNGLANTPDLLAIVPDGGNNNQGVPGYDLVFYTTCFLPGTGILTPSGEVAVEALAVGDNVMTVVNGQRVAKPVKWIGYRKLTLDKRAIAAGLAPIRFGRGSMAEHLPSRDLLVSPPHCMFIDGKLFPAKLLVNDMTIVREEGLTSVEYYHVELNEHSVLIANGVETESYLDTGNRAFFSNAGVALMLHPEFHVNAGLRCWETDACAPLVVNPAGVLPIWRKFADRAVALGCQPPSFATTNEADVHLLADGRRIDTVCVKGQVHSFVIPAGVKTLVLASRSVVPSKLRPYLDDPRELGVAIRRVIVRDDACYNDYAADHPVLSRGWHAAERADGNVWRWTKGNGVIPVDGRAAVVEVVVSETTTYLIDDLVSASRLAA